MGIIEKKVMMEAPILNFCEFSLISEKKDHVYCKKLQKDVSIEDEVKYKTVDKCPLLTT